MMKPVDIGAILSSFIDEPSRLIGILIASVLFGVGLLRLKKNDGNKDIDTSVSATKTPNAKVEDAKVIAKDGQSKTQEGGDEKLRNVFSVKQKPIVPGSGANKQTSSDRPFESSYYFAHNKHSTGGGYKDGLRAEDYVMNGPRLLSKGGVRVDDEPRNDTPDTKANEELKHTEENNAQDIPKPKVAASTPLTKYMWDDDGNGNIAKIHIDTLPISSTQTMKWESAGISKEQVEVRLIGENNEGLYVGIKQEGGKRYHLNVPKMYGEAESVKCIVKKHKLLVKITKKKIPKRYSSRHASDDGVWKSTTKALGKLIGGGSDDAKEEYTSVSWPRLSASSAGGLGGGTSEIDEKLFKGMDVSSGDDSFGM